AHPLAAHVDHRANRVHECHLATDFGESGIAAPDLLRDLSAAQPETPEPPTNSAQGVMQRPVQHERKQVLAAGQADGAQERVDLLAEAAAGDEDEPLADLRELV